MRARPGLYFTACVISIGTLASCQPAQTPAHGTPPTQSACPISPETKIQFDNGNTATYWGRGPFYFSSETSVGDFNKNPWAVDRHFTGELVIRGYNIGNKDLVNFGYWPAGYGTPAQLPDVAVSFTRQDSQGRTHIFQPELRVAPDPGRAHMREGVQYWSFPSAGCYVIEATGTGVNQSTRLTVR
jgi:hypothetical protein